MAETQTNDADWLVMRRRARALQRELNFLAARRLMRPSIEDSRRMYAIFQEMYTITNDKKWLL
jgi:hypothetical protein